MFERFTVRARRVVVLAQEEARLLDHGYIGTEHILLGLLHEGEGVAAQALVALGISLEAVRDQVTEVIGRGESSPSGHIPFTARAKKVLELSLREALALKHTYIGTEHILLGLLREGEGVAAQLLGRMGADLSRVRQEVIALVSASEQARGGAAPSDPGPDSVVFVDAELVDALLDALVACWNDEPERLAEQLGQAVQLAHRRGYHERVTLLGQLVEIDAAAAGTVRLKPRA